MFKFNKFIKERNEALFSLDRKKIEDYMRFYGEYIDGVPDDIFWAATYKAILALTDAPQDLKQKAREWLRAHGMSEEM